MRMRLTISALLLASAAAVAAAPAIAQDWHNNGGDHGNGQNSGAHEGRGDGGGRGERGQAAQPAPQAPQPRAQVAPQGRPQNQTQNQGRPDRQGQPQSQFDRGNNGGGQRGNDPRADAGRHIEGRPDNGVQVWRNNDRGQAQRQDWQNHGNDNRGNDNRQGGGDRDNRGGWNGDRGHAGGWNGNNGNRGGNWNNAWRSDRRYDWQGWRNSHRDVYRAGSYRAPYGYRGGYRRWGIGGRIDSIFFAQDYWIDNPDYYRLPPAYGGYRWVRYYNDALLIDIYSGTVADEIPNFFW
jgi:Nickel/cobalt transporter regulator